MYKLRINLASRMLFLSNHGLQVYSGDLQELIVKVEHLKKRKGILETMLMHLIPYR